MVATFSPLVTEVVDVDMAIGKENRDLLGQIKYRTFLFWDFSHLSDVLFLFFLKKNSEPSVFDFCQSISK